EVHLTNLRRKLGDDAASPRWIRTVRGVGYRFDHPS
ncbi:MAG TPA: helix-turn-helix domain-containing protein, partial [Isoptericola sp.]|nr:helix-turn-helix domain-containing protein [Isoptericola sp.]